MTRSVALAIVVAALGIIAACDSSKSATQVARDTAVAEQTAANSAAKVQQKADARIASARADVRDEQRELAHVEAIQGQKVTASQAQGEYQVALARCEGLSGATEQSCKDQANADYDVAKARTKQATASADPKPE